MYQQPRSGLGAENDLTFFCKFHSYFKKNNIFRNCLFYCIFLWEWSLQISPVWLHHGNKLKNKNIFSSIILQIIKHRMCTSALFWSSQFFSPFTLDIPWHYQFHISKLKNLLSLLTTGIYWIQNSYDPPVQKQANFFNISWFGSDIWLYCFRIFHQKCVKWIAFLQQDAYVFNHWSVGPGFPPDNCLQDSFCKMY